MPPSPAAPMPPRALVSTATSTPRFTRAMTLCLTSRCPPAWRYGRDGAAGRQLTRVAAAIALLAAGGVGGWLAHELNPGYEQQAEALADLAAEAHVVYASPR